MSGYFEAMGTAIYSALTGGTALITALGGTAIYQDQAPDGAALPYVVFSHQGGGPQNINPSGLRSNVWFVRVYADTRASAANLDGLVEARLHRKALTVDSRTNFWTAREEDLSLVDSPPSGKPVYMAGGMYRVRITGD